MKLHKFGRARCRVYWASHGCMYERGHDGPHECDCGEDSADHPMFGPTHFYGEDAEALELLIDRESPFAHLEMSRRFEV